MESVEKQYLKTCVFAIYLVSPSFLKIIGD